MTVRAALAEQLGRYDDEAWAALANRGLLRRARKDLEAAEVAVVEEDATQLRVQVGPHVVDLDARGPAQAGCSCPSASTCQHVITAGLWLAAQEGGEDGGEAKDSAGSPEASPAGGPEASPDGSPEANPAGSALHHELMAFDTDALVRHAGKAGYRWARHFVEDLDPERDVRVEADRHTSIGFSSPRVTFRYMGGGLPSLVADSRVPAIEKYQVAAVLAYQRAHGSDLPAVEPPAPRSAGVDSSLDESRARLRASTARLLTDTVRLGVSHLSPAVQQRYETVAVWAQGAEYHRLALLLRRLADHVELLLERSARADEQRLLDEAAVAHALVAALDAAAATGQAPARLVGQARNRYETVRTMELIGVGALPWRAASGYRGLTTLFWWPAESRFVSLTDARPETLGGFDPRRRYTAPGPWRGLASPSAATGARVRLTDAQVSAGGRLSGVERTHAVLTPLPGDELAGLLPVQESWTGRDHTKGPGQSLLDSPDPLRDWVVLRPTAFGAAAFDPVAQVMTWTVTDGTDRVLPLTVLYSPESVELIAQVERVAAAGVREGTLLVCRLRPGAAGVTGEPLSLVHPGRQAAESPVEALAFAGQPDAATKTSKGGRLAAAGRALVGRGTPPAPAATSPPDAPLPAAALVPRPLLDLRAWLVHQAERGTGAASPGAVTAELMRHHGRVRELGLDIFPGQASGDDVAAEILRSHYLVQQVTALLTGDPAA